AKEMRKIQMDRMKSEQDIEADIQAMRKATQGAGGSVQTQEDGSRRFYIHGLLFAIRGERYVDGNGEVTTVDTRHIKYDKVRRLQTSYTQYSRDAHGNVTTTIR